MTDIVALLGRPDTVIAVVGATDREEKYGSIIYRHLRAKGMKVRAVNPFRDSVAGDTCWRSLAELPEPPTIVNIVVPPARTLGVLDECARLGFTTVWIQPGAADQAVRDRLGRGDLDAVVDACIMVPPLPRRPPAG